MCFADVSTDSLTSDDFIVVDDDPPKDIVVVNNSYAEEIGNPTETEVSKFEI